MKIKYKH